MTLAERSTAQHTLSSGELPLTWGKLIGRNFLSEPAALFLDSAVRAGQTILVSGPQGSGRTGLLNVLGMATGYSTDRVIAVERDFQLTFPRLLADAFSLRTSGVEQHVVEQMLRQMPHHRPERFVVDDVVDDFAWQVWESLVSRCPGSAVSITAGGSPRGAGTLRRALGTSGGHAGAYARLTVRGGRATHARERCALGRGDPGGLSRVRRCVLRSGPVYAGARAQPTRVAQAHSSQSQAGSGDQHSPPPRHHTSLTNVGPGRFDGYEAPCWTGLA